MFSKIFFQRLSIYIYAAGFIVNFLVFVFKSPPFFYLIAMCIFGGAVFCGIWAGIIAILMRVLPKDDIAKIFNVKDSSAVLDVQSDKNEGLTFSELYNIDDDELAPADRGITDEQPLDNLNIQAQEPEHNDGQGIELSNEHDDILQHPQA